MNHEEVICKYGTAFKGGFLTWGKTRCKSTVFMAEGQNEDEQAIKQLVFAALPDDATVLCIQTADAQNRTLVSSIQSIHWMIPNDLFNNCRRGYQTEEHTFLLDGAEQGKKELLKMGRWLCVDDTLGCAVDTKKSLKLFRPGRRQIAIKSQPHDRRGAEGTLSCDVVCGDFLEEAQWYHPKEKIFTAAFAMVVGNATMVSETANSLVEVEGFPEGVIALEVNGKDGKRYLLLLNSLEEERMVILEKGKDLSTGEYVEGAVSLDGGKAMLVVRQ